MLCTTDPGMAEDTMPRFVISGTYEESRVVEYGELVFTGTKPECFRFVGVELGRSVPEARR